MIPSSRREAVVGGDEDARDMHASFIPRTTTSPPPAARRESVSTAKRRRTSGRQINPFEVPTRSASCFIGRSTPTHARMPPPADPLDRTLLTAHVFPRSSRSLPDGRCVHAQVTRGDQKTHRGCFSVSRAATGPLRRD